MSRTARLFDLMQALRRRRRPVNGAVLASELGVSLRMLYRLLGLPDSRASSCDVPADWTPEEEVEAVVD